MKYRISLEGCDDTTSFEMELNEEEFKLVKEIEVLSNKTSTYGCMPTLSIRLAEEQGK